MQGLSNRTFGKLEFQRNHDAFSFISSLQNTSLTGHFCKGSRSKFPSIKALSKDDKNVNRIELDSTFDSAVDIVEVDHILETVNHTISKISKSQTATHNVHLLKNEKSTTGIAPWDRCNQDTNLMVKSQPVKQPIRGPKHHNKTVFKGRRPRDEQMQMMISGSDADREEKLAAGIVAAKNTEELDRFLKLNSSHMIQADIRKLLETCLQKRQPSKIFQIIRFCDKVLDKPLGSRAMSQMISVCGRHGQPMAAQKLFDMLSARNVESGQDVYSFNALMNAYGRAGNYAESISIMERLCSGEDKIKPDCFSYTTAISHAAKSAQYDLVCSLFQEMVQVRRFKADIVTFGTVCQAYSRMGKPWLAESLLDKMGESGVSPDTNFFTTLMSGYLKIGKIREAIKVRQQMVDHRCRFSVYTYTALIQAYGVAGNLKEVEILYQSMLRDGISPTVITYNILINCFVKNSKLDEAELMLRRMQDMCQPSAAAYTAILIGYSQSGKLDKVEEVFERAVKAKVVDERLWVALGFAYIDCGEEEKAKLLLKKVATFRDVSAESLRKINSRIGEKIEL